MPPTALGFDYLGFFPDRVLLQQCHAAFSSARFHFSETQIASYTKTEITYNPYLKNFWVLSSLGLWQKICRTLKQETLAFLPGAEPVRNVDGSGIPIALSPHT